MIYQIDSKVAKEVGFIGAIMFYHISYWIKKNQSNNKHFYDGDYWTYSSVKAFSEYFEDLTESQIRQGLKNLRDCGFIKTGNYNKIPYDKTQWFALESIGKAICENYQMGLSKLSNRDCKISEPIPDITTNITTNNNIVSDETSQAKKVAFKSPTVEEVEAYGKSKGFKKTNYLDFWEYYENKGWKIGNVKMKSWQLALNRWERNQTQKNNYGTYKQFKDTSNNAGSLNDSSDYAGI